jgi:hypothetical protein
MHLKTAMEKGWQMTYFHTKNDNFGILWNGWDGKYIFMPFWYISLLLRIFVAM